jgi:hypothetical protein
MGWENRGGGRYYYTKQRVDNRVLSVYCGGGRVAELSAARDAIEREQREAKAQQWREERAAVEAQRNEVRRLGEAVDALVAEALAAEGYHQHRGEWRKRRG